MDWTNIHDRLIAPFPINDIQWRIITSGDKNGKAWAIVAPYVDSRAIMERLDSVVGTNNWQNHYTETVKGFICEITIDGITKSDGAECTDIEPTKGGISDSLKRAGVPWGIGRYLYNLPTPMYADICPNGQYSSKIKNGSYVKWNPPKLPSWALPKGTQNTPDKPPEAPQGTKEGEDDNDTDKKYFEAMEVEKKRLGKDEFDIVLFANFSIEDYKTVKDYDKRREIHKTLQETKKEKIKKEKPND